jgi:hypothetical protein
MLRIFRKSSEFKEYLGSLNISVGMMRMLNVLGLQFFMVHLMACFWFMSATLEENIFATWVGARDVVDRG